MTSSTTPRFAASERLLSRRGLLAGSASLGAVAALGATAGCAPSTTSPTEPGGPGADGAATLPSFVAYEGVKPDLPALENGTSAFFESVPSEMATFLSEKPGTGGDVSALTIVNNALVPVEKNPFWQAVNEMLGVNLAFNGASVGDYPNKFQTIMAGGELPDVCLVLPTLTPQLPALLEAKFADLSEYLSGDNVKDYPGLANIPSQQWVGGVFGPKIQLIPSPRLPLFRVYLVRADIAEQRGVNPAPRNGDELMELMAGLTDKKNHQYSTFQALGMVDMVNEMLGTPNVWGVEGGKFTRNYETETFAQALDFVAQAWKNGYLHPESFSSDIKTKVDMLYSTGQAPLLPATPNWAGLASGAKKVDPAAETAAIRLPSFDGSAPSVKRWLGAGTPYRIGIPKASPERVQELLRVISALAAPFGTKEYMVAKYGVEGTDYNVANGVITPTESYGVNRLSPLVYVGAPATVHFGGVAPAEARAEYEQEKQDMDATVAQAHIGLVSETALKKAASLDTVMVDAMTGVIQGRMSQAQWAEAVADWRRKGGDEMRAEFEAAFAAA